jgi:hypothetical protein
MSMFNRNVTSGNVRDGLVCLLFGYWFLNLKRLTMPQDPYRIVQFLLPAFNSYLFDLFNNPVGYLLTKG